VWRGGLYRKRVWLDGSFGTKSLAYRQALSHGGSRDRMLAKSRDRSLDLESIPWDVVLLGQLALGLRCRWLRSWLCSVVDNLSAEG